MSIIQSPNESFKGISIASAILFLLSLLLLSIVALEGSLAPIIMFSLMFVFAITLIIILSTDEILLKMKLFIFFFSLYVLYVLVQHYVFLTYDPSKLPYYFVDEPKFYSFSELAVPYLTGDKDFFELFSNWRLPLHDLPLHTVFSGYIAYFSMSIDGSNSIIIQKLLSPFFGGLLLMFLYLTIKHQFKDTKFALNATLAYGLLSAVFMYSTPMLRDIDIALAYMIFFYIFLQKFSFIRLALLFLVAFLTLYLRVESGMVLYGLILLYIYFYIRTINSNFIKYIFYIFLIACFSLVILIVYKKIIGQIVHLDESYTQKGEARSSVGSIALLFNKLPFGLSHTAKVLFSQMKPFPLFIAIDKPHLLLSGIFWPFIFATMIYTIVNKKIRTLIDVKIKYLLVVAIVVLYLMSAASETRRMMSIYPIIYIISLYAFFIIPKNELKRIFFYYIFGIISLNTFFYFIKL